MLKPITPIAQMGAVGQHEYFVYLNGTYAGLLDYELNKRKRMVTNEYKHWLIKNIGGTLGPMRADQWTLGKEAGANWAVDAELINFCQRLHNEVGAEWIQFYIGNPLWLENPLVECREKHLKVIFDAAKAIPSCRFGITFDAISTLSEDYGYPDETRIQVLQLLHELRQMDLIVGMEAAPPVEDDFWKVDLVHVTDRFRDQHPERMANLRKYPDRFGDLTILDHRLNAKVVDEKSLKLDEQYTPLIRFWEGRHSSNVLSPAAQAYNAMVEDWNTGAAK